MDYITMVFDIKNSRSINDRNSFQGLLINSIKKCNYSFRDIIASPFIITLGDEWQGLLKENSHYIDVVNFFTNELPKGIEFYTGIGVGEISVYDFELTVNQLDGPSFYLARKAIKYAKRNDCKLAILSDSFNL